MNPLKHALLWLLLLLTARGRAQTLHNDLALPYRVQRPCQASPHPPVLLLLHGYGSNEADLFALKDQLPGNFLVVSVQAPVAMGGNAYQWFRMEAHNGVRDGNRNDLDTASARLRILVPALVKKYQADPGQVYLAGFSQGGMMCYEVALTAPQLFKGIAPLSGKIFDSLKPRIKPNATLRRLQVFIGHGDADSRVAYHCATDALGYLRTLGVPAVLHTYPGLQHSISAQELDDMRQWLTKNSEK